MAATTGACLGVWLKCLLSELTGDKSTKALLKLDNKSAIALTKNLVHHERSKHMDPKFHFIHDCVHKIEIEVEYVSTEE